MPRINKVIKIFISSDVFFNAGWGLLAPVFAIFILENIRGGSPKTAGLAAMIYWLTKSCLEIPIGRYLDKNHGEKDDFYFMVLGIALTGIVPFGYLISSQAWHIYLCQFIYGLGMAMAIPPWYAVFTRHIDKGREAFEWGFESTALGFSAGAAGAVGGFLAEIIGFKFIFVFVGGFTFLAAILLCFIRKELILKDKITSHIALLRPFF